jgi:Fe-S-cluster containining protein
MLHEQLPELYSRYFPKPLLAASLPEKLATCDNCAMAAPGAQDISYQLHLKCCTYHPFQPNYLLGGLLGTQDSRMQSSAAMTSIDQKIRSREYVLPIGIVAPLAHQVEFNARDKYQFGNREDWLCPYYESKTQNCGIWKFRGAVCSTFFCKSSYGKKGLTFWERLSDYLTYVEMALMEEALVMLDFSPRQISENLEFLNRFEATPEELKQKVLSEDFARKIWNGYFEDQRGFFIKCFEIVSQMSKKQFHEALGEQGSMIEKDLLASLREVQGSKRQA